MKLDDTKVVTPFISVEGPATGRAKTKAPVPPQFPEEAALMKVLMDQPYDHLKFIASLIRVQRWREESWTLDKKRRGWLNWSNGSFRDFVSLEQLEAAIDSRILELGLDRQLIEEWLEEPGSAHDAWRELPFDQQMNTFRRGSL